MALTNSGFDGTVTEAAWANMSALSGVDAVESSAAWAITQGTGRQVSTAAHSGYAFARGVLSKDTAAILTSLSTPTNGQWFLIVRHIVWSTNTVSVVAIAHSTTTTTVPTVAPSTYPTVDNSPGTLYDQKLGWAWVRSTDTTVTLFDLRTLNAGVRVTAAEADIVALEAADTAITDVRQIRTYKVADATARAALTGMTEGDIADQASNDSRWRYSGTAWVLSGIVTIPNNSSYPPSPVLGDKVFRSDKGREETYYTLYNVTTNPGGKTTAGWYQTGGNPEVGAVSYPSGVVDKSGSPTRVEKSGGLVSLNISAAKAAFWADGDTICTVPVGFRIIAGNIGAGGLTNSGNGIAIFMSVGGGITINKPTTSQTDVYSSIQYRAVDTPVAD